MPLEIERISKAEGCRVRRAEADITINAALVEFLRQRHRLDLGLDELPEDEAGIDVRAIVGRLTERIGALPGWGVHLEAHVACLDFRKWPIWTDIRDRRAAVAAARRCRPTATALRIATNGVNVLYDSALRPFDDTLSDPATKGA